jgi:hypothetical protein
MSVYLKMIITALLLSVITIGCSNRLVDFTIISSKTLGMHYQDGAKGQRVKGSSMGFLGFGANIKSAVDDAIEKAGSGYDALIDGVLYERDNIIITGYEVEGTPVNTSKLLAELGKDGFDKFCMAHRIDFYSKQNQ